MKFQKVHEHSYLVEVPDEVVNRINELMEELSDNKQQEYAAESNMILFNSMISRKIGSEFYKQYNLNELEASFVVIDAVIGDLNISVSVGEIPVDNGKTIKLVSSYYK